MHSRGPGAPIVRPVTCRVIGLRIQRAHEERMDDGSQPQIFPAQAHPQECAAVHFGPVGWVLADAALERLGDVHPKHQVHPEPEVANRLRPTGHQGTVG